MLAVAEDGEAIMCGRDHRERSSWIVAVGVPEGAVSREGVELLEEHAAPERHCVMHHVDLKELWVGGERVGDLQEGR